MELTINCDRMRIYAHNCYDIWLSVNHLCTCVKKRMQNKKTVYINQKSPQINAVAERIAAAVKEHDGVTISKEDKRQFRLWLAAYIIEDAKKKDATITPLIWRCSSTASIKIFKSLNLN